MMDREKVVKGLKICTSKPCYCTDCPYKANCCLDSQEVMEDALAMLKEQEAKIEQLNRFVNGFSRDAMPVVRCKDCKFGEPWGVLIGCGTSKGFGITHDPDWFCADGERKEGREVNDR